ncbi:unnamed protein product, partial [Iphiclides podalirius]
MDALLFVLILEVVLLQMRILERSATLSARQNSSFETVNKHQRNKLIRDRLIDNTKQELLTKRYHRSVQLRYCNEKIASLKDEIRDSQINAKAQLRYVDKWICASANALELRHQIKPASLPSQDHEQRVHGEIVRAYELQVKEREEMLRYWKLRYTEDTKNITEQVVQQRERLKATIARRVELQKLYDYHAGEMRAWLTFKKERAARLAREQRSRLAATRIQAWWRGLMVRRALGAFKHLRNTKKPVNKIKKK